MTPDTIITAEILACLDKCPFCGAPQTRIRFGEWASYQCLSSFHVNQKASRTRSIPCEQTERDALRAKLAASEDDYKCAEAGRVMLFKKNEELCKRVSALEAKVQRLTEAGDAIAKAAEEYGIPYHNHLPSIWTEAKGQQ